jgi:hypothetical protein
MVNLRVEGCDIWKQMELASVQRLNFWGLLLVGWLIFFRGLDLVV